MNRQRASSNLRAADRRLSPVDEAFCLAYCVKCFLRRRAPRLILDPILPCQQRPQSSGLTLNLCGPADDLFEQIHSPLVIGVDGASTRESRSHRVRCTDTCMDGCQDGCVRLLGSQRSTRGFEELHGLSDVQRPSDRDTTTVLGDLGIASEIVERDHGTTIAENRPPKARTRTTLKLFRRTRRQDDVQSVSEPRAYDIGDIF